VTNNRADRQDRLRNALRENLKRRKAQIKGRAATADHAADEGSIEHEPTPPAGPADTKRLP
jgi:hypothetical protein